MTPDEQIAELVADLQKQGKLPRSLGPRQLRLLAQSLANYSGQVSQRIQEKILADFKAKLAAAQSNVTPDAQRGVIADLTRYVQTPEIAERIRESLHLTQQVASGGGRYLNAVMSPEVLDEYPCWELKRMFARAVPRGFALGPKGDLIAVPDDDWPSRWDAAGGELYDGRMIATKDDDVWQALGDGEGGYDDTLGNPFPPFAFNSGFMTYNVSRKEAIALGVMEAEDVIETPKVNFGRLFNFN